MSTERDTLERRLEERYAAQFQHYDDAMRILDDAEDQEDGAPWVDRLQAALRKVEELDRAMAADKDAWRRGGYSAGSLLGQTLDALGERIQKLGERIDRRIAAVTARREKLLPEVTSLVVQRRMLNAYTSHAS